jgi:hypothetical protein
MKPVQHFTDTILACTILCVTLHFRMGRRRIEEKKTEQSFVKVVGNKDNKEIRMKEMEIAYRKEEYRSVNIGCRVNCGCYTISNAIGCRYSQTWWTGRTAWFLASDPVCPVSVHSVWMDPHPRAYSNSLPLDWS